MKKRKAVVLYGSLTGNTEMVGKAFAEVLESMDLKHGVKNCQRDGIGRKHRCISKITTLWCWEV